MQPNPILLRARQDHLAHYFHQLNALLHAGVSIGPALASMSEEGTNYALRNLSAEMSRQVMAGKLWSEELRRYPTVFTPMMVAVIAAGEAGGFLEKATLILAQEAEREYEIYQLIKRETWYSKCLLVVSVTVIPLFQVLLGGVNPRLEMLNGFFVLCLFWAIWKGLNYLWPMGAQGDVKHWIDRQKLKLPIVGKTVRGFAAAKFCRFLAMAIASGISITRGVELAAAACGNSAMQEKLGGTIQAISAGREISDVLIATGELPRTVRPLLLSGETSGTLDTQLQAAARFVETDAETALRQSVIALCMFLFLMVAALIGRGVIRFHAGI